MRMSLLRGSTEIRSLKEREPIEVSPIRSSSEVSVSRGV